MSFAIDGSRKPASIVPSIPITGFSLCGIYGVFEVRVPVPFPVPVRSSKHVRTTADGTSKGLRITSLYCDGVWLQLLICHYGRYTVPIITLLPPLGSFALQTTLIAGSLTEGSESVLSRGVRTHAHNLQTVQVLPREPIGSLWGRLRVAY